MATTTIVEPAPVEADFVTVKTTLPVQPMPPNDSRPVATTERLLLRPLRQDDLGAVHALRTQEEVMERTYVGRIDRDLGETQAKLDHFLPPNDARTHEFAICLKETGELIGMGGSHSLQAEFGWPELGYMFRREHWGGGLATEFVQAYKSMWASLPRAEIELRVDPRSATGDGVSEEQLIAITSGRNTKSQSVLRKSGFDPFITWKGGRSLEDPEGAVVPLPTFRFFPGRKSPGDV